MELTVTNRSRLNQESMESEADGTVCSFEGSRELCRIILDSSVVERSAVNRNVVGSSYSGSLLLKDLYFYIGLFFMYLSGLIIYVKRMLTFLIYNYRII